MKILIVDDEPLARERIRTMLKSVQSDNYVLFEAANGGEAIDLINLEFPDVVFLDIQMPEMDGFETTHYIRNSIKESINKTPIIAMTASALVSEKAKCLQSGMNDYISKPFQAKDLCEKISLQLN